jgi:hypothetical protein
MSSTKFPITSSEDVPGVIIWIVGGKEFLSFRKAKEHQRELENAMPDPVVQPPKG